MFIVPVQGETNVAGSSPVCGEFILFFEDFKQSVNLGTVGISDSKVVNDERKHEIAVEVLPEVRSDSAGYVSMWLKEDVELFIGETPGLRQAIHSFSDFRIYVSVSNLVVELVKVHDGCGEHVEQDAYVFIIFEVAT